MSVSLSVERDRIQQQVERLEQSLSAPPTELELLSSETDDEADGDSEDEAGQTAAGLLAQKEKIQSEIQNLENLLGPHSPVCVSDDSSSSDESELDLSPSVDSCLQMNLVYQQVIQETLNQLETLLTHNNRQQKEMLSQLSGPIKESSKEQPAPTSYQQPISMYLGRFLKPYFKDKLTGLGPPANQETREKASRMTGCLDDKKLKTKRWESWQKNLLIHSVSRDSLRRLIQPKLFKVDYLSQKLSSAEQTDKQQLRQQIDSLERDINLLRGKKEEELIGDRYEDHDWQKISNIDFEGTRDAEDIRCFWQNFLHPSVNKSRWSQEEVQQLKEISRRHEERHWESIAQQLGTGRTAFMCLQTFQRFVSDSLRRSAWTPAEDALLRVLVDKMRIGNFIPYTQMSYFMDGRDPAQLIYRWNQVLDPSLKKGPWTYQEDQLLLQAVSRHGEKNWWKIRLEVPGRTDSACRDRYHDCLKAGTKRGSFDKHELELLLQLVEKHGVGRWAKIAAEIPNRFDAQCLREWKKLTRQPPPVQKKNKAKSKSNNQEEAKKKVVGPAKRSIKRRLMKLKVEEEETSEEEEEEEMVVEYIDSDDEKKKKKVVEVKKIEEVDKEVERKDERYTIPPMEEWIPAEKPQHFTFLSFRPVTLQSSSGAHCGESVRSTILGQYGRSVIIGPNPRVLQSEERHNSNTMMMVSPDQLQAHLYRLMDKFKSQSSGSPNRKLQTGKQNHLGRVTDMGLGYKLQAAVTPWIGNLLIPAKTRLMAADALREHGEKVQLPSTPIFLLLLQTMNVDTIGCKEIIEQRRSGVVLLTPPSDPPSIQKKPKTVAGILQQRKIMKEELQDLDLQHKMILKQLHGLQQRFIPPPLHLLSTPPHNRSGFLLQMPTNMHPQISPLSFPRTVFSPQPALQPQQPCAAPIKLVPASSWTLPLTPHKPPPAGVVSSPPHAASSVSVVPMPSTAGSQLAIPSFLNPPHPPTKTEAPSLSPPSGPTAAPPLTLNVPPVSVDSRTCSQVSSSQNLSVDSPTSVPTNQHAASSTSSLPNPFLCDHDYTVNNHYSTLIQPNPAPSVPDSASNQPIKAPSRGRKRGRGEEQQSETGDSMDRASTSVIQDGKRVRKPSQKAKALQEATEAKVEAKKKRAPSFSPRKKRCHTSHIEEDGILQQQPVIQLPRSNLFPDKLMWVMTSSGLVQVSLVRVPGSAPPRNVLTHQPTVPPLHFTASAHPPAAMPVPVKLAPAFILPGTNPASCLVPSCPPLPPPKIFLPYKGTVRADPTAPPPLRREALQFDPSLMFLESQAEVCDWLSGRGGVVVPGLRVSLPYLPPFISSLSTLSALLRVKGSLTKSSLQLLSHYTEPRCHPAEPDTRNICSQASPELPDSTSDHRPAGDKPAPSVSTDPVPKGETELVVAIRQLVMERFAGNPAYQLLKARFLSCFTVPALLATVQPITEKTIPCPANEDVGEETDEEKEEEEEGLKRIKERGIKRRAAKSLLLCDRSGAPANHFSGIISTNATWSDQKRPDQTVRNQTDQ
ncbi:hypothetical protein PAMA_017794 [Pampus argenteus]